MLSKPRSWTSAMVRPEIPRIDIKKSDGRTRQRNVLKQTRIVMPHHVYRCVFAIGPCMAMYACLSMFGPRSLGLKIAMITAVRSSGIGTAKHSFVTAAAGW